MGYTTEFDGSVSISPPLNAHEIAYLRKFAASRRMDRARGPYFVDGSGPFGQGHDDDIRDFASRTTRSVVLVGADQGRHGHQVERRGEVL
jgi:hypothetical protein